MKLLLFCFLSVTTLLSCSTPKQLQINIENPSNHDRLQELAELDLRDVKSKIRNNSFIIRSESGNEIPYQITYDNKVLFQASVKSGQKQSYNLEKGTQKTVQNKTYARFITERKDDFAWENDKVAFRLYGPALVATDGPSNGLDIWYKRTSDLIIDKWYKDDLAGKASYHEDHGEGLDDYKVGPTLGSGGMAPFVDGKLILNENFVSQEILENGPLRTTFKLTYKSLNVNGENVTETRTISLDAGSYLTKIIQEYGTKKSFDVAAGIIKRPNSTVAKESKDKTFIVYAEPQNVKVSGVYIALLNPEGWNQVIENTYKTDKGETYTHTLTTVTYKPNVPVTYYTGFGWSKYGFKDIESFENYLEKQGANLKKPLKISVVKK